MIRRLAVLIVVAWVTGCTPELFTRPTIPYAPPERPSTASGDAKLQSRNRGPVTASQVSEQNVRQMIGDLEAEIEADARHPLPKP